MRGEDGRYHVFQVKKFAANLKASEKKQIEKSFKRLVKYTSDRGMLVSGWSLVTPLDRTNENRIWLETLTKGAGFSVEWRGLSFVDGLASEFPDVVDYYLRDGRDRLETAVASLTTLLRMQSDLDDSSKKFEPGDASASLYSLHEQMNRYDPHYRYDFSVDAERPNAELLDVPGLVCAVQESNGKSHVTIKVITRFADAVQVRPIPFSFRVSAEKGSELERTIQDFGNFGVPVTFPVEGVELSLPGGLGVESSAGEVSIGLPKKGSMPSHEMRFDILDPSGVTLASTGMVMHTVTKGRVGADLYGTEENGVFNLTLRMVFPNLLSRVNIKASNDSLTGKRLESVLPGLNFLANFHAPNVLKMIDPFTGAQAGSAELGEGSEHSGADAIRVCVEDLLSIQEVVGRRILAPDFSVVPLEDTEEWSRAARLIRGQDVEITWDSIAIHIKPGFEQSIFDQFPGALVLRYPMLVDVAGENYDVGLCQFWTPGAQLKSREGVVIVEDQQVFAVPMDGSRGVLRMGGKSDPPELQG